MGYKLRRLRGELLVGFLSGVLNLCSLCVESLIKISHWSACSNNSEIVVRIGGWATYLITEFSNFPQFQLVSSMCIDSPSRFNKFF